jgi:hypothetical protein
MDTGDYGASSGQVLARCPMIGSEVEYFVVELFSFNDEGETPYWKTTCSEGWKVEYPFEWTELPR